MCFASCGFENPDGMEFVHPSSAVSTALPLPARAPTPSSYPPQHLAAKLLTSPSALAGQRQQLTVNPDVMEERDEL
jgi:hypothetical protein